MVQEMERAMTKQTKLTDRRQAMLAAMMGFRSKQMTSRWFFHKSSGSISFGHFPHWKIFFDWRDASDGITFIWPRLTWSHYPEYE
jgi:hypothetical protein